MIVSKTLSVGGPLDHGVTMPTIDNIAHENNERINQGGASGGTRPGRAR